jgi:pimeloyl-ACP methyl ester carboxylesterase
MEKPYDHPEIDRRYFFPEVGRRPSASDIGQPVDLQLESRPEVVSCFDCRLFGVGAPTLLYFHGNGERVVHQLPQWPEWAHLAGANIFLVDYPGYGASSGEPSLSSCAAAARAAMAHLLRRDGTQGIIIGGRSVGSIFALDVAAHYADNLALRGVFIESGISDIVERIDLRVPYRDLGLDRQAIESAVRQDFDQKKKMEALACPVMILHTEHDGLVDRSHAERLASWAGKRLFHFELFEAGDHNSIQLYNEAAYRELLQQFISACSKGVR